MAFGSDVGAFFADIGLVAYGVEDNVDGMIVDCGIG